MAENPLLRRRIAEIGEKLALARAKRDELKASPPTGEQEDRLKMIDREIALLTERMKSFVEQLVSRLTLLEKKPLMVFRQWAKSWVCSSGSSPRHH